MLTFHILTIFPEYFKSPLSIGVIGKAIEKGTIQVNIVNIRGFGHGERKTIDDKPYGGGPGMILMVEPVVKSLRSIKFYGNRAVKILLTPSGEVFNQRIASELADMTDIVLICARYEGIDERVTAYIDREISIGDYVLPGGEAAALAILESIARLVKGVVGNEECAQESIERNILSYPQYTRPRSFEELDVPEILLSGDHKRIELWRREQMLRRTLQRRPDLLNKAQLSDFEKKLLESIIKG